MKYSVIVPVYNCMDDLSACVNSVLQQTERDFELLLIDDGSNDGSAALCDQFAAQDNRIRVFHKANGGASSARNLGLRHAIGDYILFVDGDDTVERSTLERISSALSETSPQMVIFGMAFDYFDKAGRLEKTEHLSVRNAGLLSSEEILSKFSDFFEDNALSSACNKVFEGRILRDTVMLFSEEMTLYEDLDFVLRYLSHCQRIACLDCALYHYRLSTQKPHINQRVLFLEKLQHNLDLLNASVMALHAPEAAQRTADLCTQLFDMHLMTAPHPRRELPQVIAAMRESAALHALSEVGIRPSPSASPSWPLILRNDATALYISLQNRKLKRKAKEIVKPALKKVGLYHGKQI